MTAVDEGRSARVTRVVVAVVLLVAVAAAGGLLAGSRMAAGAPRVPADDSIDAGFARDMQVHHAQAVQMSVLVRERTQDSDVRTLALDVLLTQQQQAGQMYGWLRQWNLPQTSSGPVMSWMPDAEGDMPGMESDATTSMSPTHGQDPAVMPGMASPQDIERLGRATGTEAERLYLQLMISHHEGGVAMASVAVEGASDADVRRLAQTIVDSQTSELTVLRDMLAARGGPISGT